MDEPVTKSAGQLTYSNESTRLTPKYRSVSSRLGDLGRIKTILKPRNYSQGFVQWFRTCSRYKRNMIYCHSVGVGIPNVQAHQSDMQLVLNPIALITPQYMLKCMDMLGKSKDQKTKIHCG